MRRKDHRGTRIDPTTGTRRPLTAEENDIRGKIKKGLLPKYHFARTYGSDKMERMQINKNRKPKLTWKILDTFNVLTAPTPPTSSKTGAQ